MIVEIMVLGVPSSNWTLLRGYKLCLQKYKIYHFDGVEEKESKIIQYFEVTIQY